MCDYSTPHNCGPGSCSIMSKLRENLQEDRESRGVDVARCAHTLEESIIRARKQRERESMVVVEILRLEGVRAKTPTQASSSSSDGQLLHHNKRQLQLSSHWGLHRGINANSPGAEAPDRRCQATRSRRPKDILEQLRVFPKQCSRRSRGRSSYSRARLRSSGCWSRLQ